MTVFYESQEPLSAILCCDVLSFALTDDTITCVYGGNSSFMEIVKEDLVYPPELIFIEGHRLCFGGLRHKSTEAPH